MGQLFARFAKHTQKQAEFYKKLEKRVSDQPPYFYLHFSQIPKIGIKPRHHGYSGPHGIYVYILNSRTLKSFQIKKELLRKIHKNPKDFTALIEADLGMFQMKPFVFILKGEKEKTILYSSKPISEKEFFQHVKKIKDLAKGAETHLFAPKWDYYLNNNSVEKIVHDFSKGRYVWERKISWPLTFIFEKIMPFWIPGIKLHSPGNRSAVLLEMAKLFAASGSFQRKRRKSIAWATILRKIGIAGYIDDLNLDILWKSNFANPEVSQGVFFSRPAIEIVEFYKNPFSIFSDKELQKRTSSSYISEITSTSREK